MFNVDGISSAVEGREALVRLAEERTAERARLEQKEAARRAQWKQELLVLWSNFVASQEWADLIHAMQTMGMEKERLYLRDQHTFSLDCEEGEKPFRVVSYSCRSLSETKYSPEEYFILLYRGNSVSPEQVITILKQQFDNAFERIKHNFRYNFDEEYHQWWDKKKLRRTIRVRIIFSAVVATLIAVGYFLMFG